LLALAAAGPIALMFASRFRFLYELWQTDDNYSHGFLIPLVSAYLAWGVWHRQGWPERGNYPLGGLLLGLGCSLRLSGVIVGLPLVDFLALAMMLFGLAVMVGGVRWAWGFAFPILFLFFMFPLPSAVDVKAAVALQGMVASISTGLLQLFVPAYQDGNGIILPGGHPMYVGEQCSGLRQIVAFAALTLLVAYLSKRRRPFWVGILLAGVPVAVAANILRILLMAFLILHFGEGAISEEKIIAFGISYHVAWGLLTMCAGLALLGGIAWWLGRLFPDPPAESPPAAGEAVKDNGPAAQAPQMAPRALARWLGGAVLCLILMALAQQALVAHLSAAEPVVASSRAGYLARPLQGAKGFPVSLGVWDGKDSPPDPLTLPYYNNADDKLNRKYTAADDESERPVTCQLWMIHYHNATDRRHFPTGCYRGAGWKEDLSGREEVPLTGDGAPAQKFCFTKGAEPVYAVNNVYYWHYTLDLPDGLGLSLAQRMHEAWSVRRPSLTVQVFTDARTPGPLSRVAEFVRLVDDALQAHLPPGARRGNDSLPITDLRAPRTGTRR
jgi:exosortase